MAWQPISTAREFESVLTLHRDDLFPTVAFRVGDIWMREVEGPEDDVDRPGMLDVLYQTPTWWMSLDYLPPPPED